ncbi:unnamed protein product [Cyprideis torosa]|uniref:26S proteasome non-ATPase regulatory subunit 4 n=1 Tax=Cyprideis torosa TaxID=163714 RepID=A0A7R8W505_9CRUS|nr:unnamed protein product [Cyprideis torosa]CAG0881215.1 unnamed protein product [Cyprideis torosa]
MVLESTMICIDNSDFMRNGDFAPTRIQAQQDAVNLLFHSKTRQNPENNVGLITLAQPKVLTTLTSDPGKIMAKLHSVQPGGTVNLVTGIRIAHLALKHRQGKNHKMRIIVFVGSPVPHNEKDLVDLAKKLKKEKVSVDVVNFGEEQDENQELLQKFVETVGGGQSSSSSSGGSCHLATLISGCDLVDALVQSPIVGGEGGAGGGASGMGFDFGVNPNDDPELALALRVSMEEQRARQEAEARKAQEGGQPGSAIATEATPSGGMSAESSEEAMLQRALAASMGGPVAPIITPPAQPASANQTPDFSRMSEEEMIRYAMQMSMQEMEAAGASKTEEQAKEDSTKKSDPSSRDAGGAGIEPMAVDEPAETNPEDFSEVLQDQEFIQGVLGRLPGVDIGQQDPSQQRSDKTEQGDKKKGGK